MRRPVFAANWKMNHGPSEARAFATALAARWTCRDDRTTIVFPPALSLTTVADALGSDTGILLGVQNIWTEAAGAFTGENSATMAHDAGARFALVGHSERRHIFGETDDQTAKKCLVAVRGGLTPLLCVGELLAQREAGTTANVVLRQLRTGISELAPDMIATMLVAYEPVWAIGTGRTATPDDAAAVHETLRAALREIIGARADEIPLLYGGSVNRANAKALLSADGVDGLLVGGASLDVEGWATICDT